MNRQDAKLAKSGRDLNQNDFFLFLNLAFLVSWRFKNVLQNISATRLLLPVERTARHVFFPSGVR